MRYAILLVPLLALLAACAGGGEEPQPTPTPSPAAARPSPTPEPTAEPTPSPIPKPDPQTLLQPGYVLDQALEVNLDGSETGQIVVISHTVREDAAGQPVVSAVPEECPDSTVLGGEPSPCVFRVEIFTYDAASGWTSKFLQEGGDPKHGGLFPAGITQAVEVTAFGPGVTGPQAVVVTYTNCGGSNCPVQGHRVLAMRDGAVAEVYGAFDSSVEIGGNSAAFAMAFYAKGALFAGLSGPNGILVQTVEIDPQTGDVGLAAARLDICAEGDVITAPMKPPNPLFVRCLDPNDPTYSPPRHVGGFETTNQTVVEPAAVGLSGLKEGDHVKVDYTIKECPQSLLDCSPDSITPVATKITVMSP